MKNNETRRQREDFLVNCLQARSSPSKNFGAPLTQGNKKQKSHETTSRTARLKYLEDPEKRDKNSERIETEPQGKLMQKSQSIFPKTLEPPPENVIHTHKVEV